ncbi:bactofilin family protein [Kiloniella sp.]|uniref:bactofilin family protein n=1 Tax=Kiloniella sp. TaxID=1938587 RepID=UPI003B02B448
MFSKSNKPNTKVATTASPSKKIEPSGIPSILSPDLSLTGDLTSTGDLQIDGTVQGDITCRSVTIGEKAVVTGSVNAEEIRVCGMVSGQLNANTLTLASTAKVIGDILHKSIAIEAGAQVEGQFKRISDQADYKSQVLETLPLKETPAINSSATDNGFSNLNSSTSESPVQSNIKQDDKVAENKPSSLGSSSWNSNSN